MTAILVQGQRFSATVDGELCLGGGGLINETDS